MLKSGNGPARAGIKAMLQEGRGGREGIGNIIIYNIPSNYHKLKL